MGIAVYPRLSELLRAHNLSVAELERRLKRRFGFQIDPKTLYRLTHADPIQRADLEIAGAVAAILGVGLDDIFDVRVTPLSTNGDVADDDLTTAESRRLAELFDCQATTGLTTTERAELERLVDEFGRRLHEQRLHEIAELRGISIDQARSDMAAELRETVQWWHHFEADPKNRRTLASSIRRRRRRSIE